MGERLFPATEEGLEEAQKYAKDYNANGRGAPGQFFTADAPVLELRDPPKPKADPKYPNEKFRRLAEVLHKKLCHSNHTDGCSWMYGDWSKPTYAHGHYYDKAERMYKAGGGRTPEDIIRVIELL